MSGVAYVGQRWVKALSSQQHHLVSFHSTINPRNLFHDAMLSKSIALGGEEFAEKIKLQFSIKGKHRETVDSSGVFFIKAPDVSYTTLFTRDIDVVSKKLSVIFY